MICKYTKLVYFNNVDSKITTDHNTNQRKKKMQNEIKKFEVGKTYKMESDSDGMSVTA